MIRGLLRRLRGRPAAMPAAMPAEAPKPQPFDFCNGYPPRLAENVRTLAEEHGLARSMACGECLDGQDQPIPWYTFPAIEYFRQWDCTGWNVFEYGCGNSSLFWAGRGARVSSVEHDAQWHERMLQRVDPARQRLLLRQDRESYAAAIRECGEAFDMVVVDGVWRNECAAQALPRLKPGGLVLLDNADWYTDVAATLRERGFFQVDFSGFGPINFYAWTTSLFLPFAAPWQRSMAMPTPVGGITIAERGETW